MKDRLKEFLIEKKLSAKGFALEIGVQPSSVSHILTGRNKPSVELLEKLLHSFPDTDLKYLISGIRLVESTVEKDTELNKTMPITEHDLVDNKNPEIDLSTNVTSEVQTVKIVIFRSDGTFEEYSR